MFRPIRTCPYAIRRRSRAWGWELSSLLSCVKAERNYFWDLVIATNEPRDWSPNDSLLLEEIAERTWVAIERTRTEKVLR